MRFAGKMTTGTHAMTMEENDQPDQPNQQGNPPAETDGYAHSNPEPTGLQQNLASPEHEHMEVHHHPQVEKKA